jgi:5'-3' exonuclease
MKMQNIFETDDVKRLLTIDAHNSIFRTIAVAESETTKKGIIDLHYTYWKHLYLNMMLNQIKKFKAEKMVMAIDSKNVWRRDIYPAYKATRKANRDKSTIDFDKFFPVLEEYLKDLKEVFSPIIFAKIDRCEGDDIIAAIVQNDRKSQITIVSTDKDLNQLLKFKNVKQFDPIKKTYVQSLNPEVDLQKKIIMGDKGDNIPAIKARIGKVTAANIITEGTLDDLLNDIETGELVKNNLVRNTQLIDLSYIPKEIQTKVTDYINTYPTSPLDGKKLFDFAVKHRLPNLIDEIENIKNTVGVLNE